MATLPESDFNITNGIAFEDYPSLTFYVDPVSHRISGLTDGFKAIKQAVEIIVNIERFKWQIYSPYFGMQWNGLIGQSPEYVASEMQRRLKDAFSTDNRILGIRDFNYKVEKENLQASFVVETVFGETQQTVEVSI